MGRLLGAGGQCPGILASASSSRGTSLWPWANDTLLQLSELENGNKNCYLAGLL